jgi:hypothetical protein
MNIHAHIVLATQLLLPRCLHLGRAGVRAHTRTHTGMLRNTHVCTRIIAIKRAPRSRKLVQTWSGRQQQTQYWSNE